MHGNLATSEGRCKLNAERTSLAVPRKQKERVPDEQCGQRKLTPAAIADGVEEEAVRI